MILAENLSNLVPPCSLSVEGAALLDTNWRKLYEAAILEIVPDKLAIRIGGRAGHRSTRITCGYYRTRASQVGGCPFNAQDPEQDFHAVRATHSKPVQSYVSEKQAVYCTELATEEKTLFALLPTRRIVPTTITRITASITAYSAMSCPLSSLHKYRGRWNIRTPLQILILILVYPPERQEEKIVE